MNIHLNYKSFLSFPISICLSGCPALQQIAQSQAQFYGDGNLTVLMCTRPGLNDCQSVSGINISGDVVKMDNFELPESIVNTGLRSFQVTCGRPTSITLYEKCNFRGDIAVYHCAPASGQSIGTLDVNQLGGLTGKVSGIALSDETSKDLTDTAIPLITAPAQISNAITQTLTGNGGAMSNRSGYCPLINECCAVETIGSGGQDRPDAIIPNSTEVFWTEANNVGNELPRQEDDSDHLSRSCLTRDDGSLWSRKNLLGIQHRMTIRAGGSDYPVVLSWYLEPKLIRDPDPRSNNQGTLSLPLYQTHYRVYSTQFPGSVLDGWIGRLVNFSPQGRLENGISSALQAGGRTLACEILAGIKDEADRTVSGAGEAVLTKNKRITWTYKQTPTQGETTCNLNKPNLSSCTNYRSVAPTLVLHKQ
ncbi:MAG: hypothetical protein PHE55_11790 [Methylococcaceae bacterium]|nr:hypothetical protein [Methylococcaceae bacterium]